MELEVDAVDDTADPIQPEEGPMGPRSSSLWVQTEINQPTGITNRDRSRRNHDQPAHWNYVSTGVITIAAEVPDHCLLPAVLFKGIFQFAAKGKRQCGYAIYWVTCYHTWSHSHIWGWDC